MVLVADRPGIKLPMRSMTDDEFYYLCQENPDFKFERDTNGNIISMALTDGDTGRRNSDLVIELGIWNRTSRAGIVFDSSTGFKLPNGANRSPDVAFVAMDKWNALTSDERTKYPPPCPDFLVELMSETDYLREATDKMQEYMENGCRLAWLINPKTEEARLYSPDGSVRVIHSFDNTLSGDDVLLGFTFDLALLR